MRPDQASQPELKVRRLDPGPLNADWAWTPDGWQAASGANGDALSPAARLFHDDETARIAVTPLADGVALQPEAFQGGFVSVALDLPESGVRGLSPHHVVSADIGLERPLSSQAFLRLNLRLGPDTIMRMVGLPSEPGWASIDLDRAFQDARTVDHAWLDLICERPGLSRLSFAVKAVRRHPRPAM